MRQDTGREIALFLFDSVRLILPYHVWANVPNLSLLHVAASQGNVETAQRLILRGIDINLRDIFGWTPLHLACNNGHVQVVILLCSFGAEVDSRGPHGHTPLHRACLNDRLSVIEVLSSLPTNFLAVDENGLSALFYRMQYSLVNELRQRG